MAGMEQVSAQSKLPKHLRPDGRSWQGKLVARARRELTAHCGGAPTATQARLIEQAAALSLALTMDERAMLEGRSVSPQYPALHVALSAALGTLGVTALPVAAGSP